VLLSTGTGSSAPASPGPSEERFNLHFFGSGLHFLDNHSGDLYLASASAIIGKRREVIAGTAIEPQLPIALAGDDAEASCLTWIKSDGQIFAP
jgi:hypothetical protein